MIYVYRHAHAGKRSDHDGPDHERPLTGRGWTESGQIAEALAGNGITRILTSPYLRCVQSVEPLSEATGIAIEIEPVLAEGTGGPEVDALMADLEPGTVVCSHGDIISGYLGRASAEGADLDGGLIWEKGSVWAIERGPAGRVSAGRYSPPPITAS